MTLGKRYAATVPLLLLGACDRSTTSTDGMRRGAGTTSNSAESRSVADDAAASSSLPVPARASRVTWLREKECKLIETIEETGDWTRSCPGLAGYTLTWESGDLREDLTVVRGGREAPLDVPALVANGAFVMLDRAVEWRGAAGSTPDVLILRARVTRRDGTDDGGHLVIARLAPAPCIVASVAPAAGQSERARAIADRQLPPCLRHPQAF